MKTMTRQKSTKDSKPKSAGPEALAQISYESRDALLVMFTVPPTAKGLLSKKQIAALLDIGESLLKDMIRDGRYPESDLKCGKLPRWTVDTHNAWIEAQRAQIGRG